MDPYLIAAIALGLCVLVTLIALVLRFSGKEDPPATPAVAPQAPNVLGHGPPASQSAVMRLRTAAPQQQTPSPAQAERFVRVSGHSDQSHHPRELDLTSEADEIHLHVHQHGESHTKVRIEQEALQVVLEQWAQTGKRLERVEVPGRTARKELLVGFVFHDNGEVEVQADWWIRVSTQELTAALQRLGVRVP
jgi:hypothetical protein